MRKDFTVYYLCGVIKLLPIVAVICSFGSALVLSSTTAHARNDFLVATGSVPPPSGARNLCREYSWACAKSVIGTGASISEFSIVQSVNRTINSNTRSISDLKQYRRIEFWSLPTRRGGDCEDFALLKKRDLISHGVDPARLLLATVLDRRRNSHAVLIYRSDRGDLVLDNMTNRILPWQKTRYVFLRMQDPTAPASWLGGFQSG